MAKSKNKVSKPRKVARFAGGYVDAGASSYKGGKRFALDHKATRGQATAVGVGTSVVAPAAVAGSVNQGLHAAKEGVLPAHRATNKPSTQKRKNKAKTGVAGFANATIGRKTVGNRRIDAKHGSRPYH